LTRKMIVGMSRTGYRHERDKIQSVSVQHFVNCGDPDIADNDKKMAEVYDCSPREPRDAPLPPTGVPHPSVGSYLHLSDDHCAGKPCVFYYVRKCRQGYDCEFCHYRHTVGPSNHKLRSILRKCRTWTEPQVVDRDRKVAWVISASAKPTGADGVHLPLWTIIFVEDRHLTYVYEWSITIKKWQKILHSLESNT